ncbi:AzlC family ABC transporter permease [Candidatus Thioglobus sp.]|nr:AzlC family ABC transporter permease [Candidatus Thioglobus sp.]
MVRSALKTSLPIMFGFVPLGIAFGLLFQELGYPWFFATLMGIIVYAGAAQFMAIGFLSAGLGVLEIAMSTFFLNSRHMFYGLAFLESFGNWNLRKFYLIFGMTDETYALLTTIKVPEKYIKERFYLFITLFAQLYWVLGCTIGALSADILAFNTDGIEFAATALFVVLLIEQWIMVRRILPFTLGFIASIIALIFFVNHMLLIAIMISIASIVILRVIKIKNE